jgi:DNA polymerase-3 subunit beta
MHFEVEKNVFIKALGKVSKATGSSSVVTRSIYFEVENGIAKIVGFDNTKHISIITTIAVTGDNGKFLVDASMLQGMLSKMNGDKVSIEVADNGSSAIIKCGKTKTTLTLADVSLFPITAIELVNTEPVISVPYDILKALIGVSFASGTSDMANAIMTAVDFKWKDGKFIVSALDGHRVARRYVAMNGKEFNVHVAAQHLKAIFAAMDTKSAITIKVSGNAIEFNDGTTTASTAIVDGNFFDIDKFQSGLVEDTTVYV